MKWIAPKPLFSNAQVDSAGVFLFRKGGDTRYDEEKIEREFEIVSNWRTAHNYPLNSVQKDLRKRARRIDSNSFVAQRIKRIASINDKIARYPSMRLSMMQDIGGCRAVMGNVQQVIELVRDRQESGIKHEMILHRDYITKPKTSGYRGVHLIYRYLSDTPETKEYSGLKVEMQIRTALQHAWATAVETVGTFTNQALKSSQGNKEWLRFFELIGSAMAIREGTNLVPETPDKEGDLKEKLLWHARKLDVKNQLQTYGSVLNEISTPSPQNKFYLIELDPAAKEVRIKGYRTRDLNRANEEYLAIERNMRKGNNAVLVSSDSVAALRRAYPNYFLDTHAFIEALETAIA